MTSAEVAVKQGGKITFMGDSITQTGARPGGYVRLEKNVLSKKPDWMPLSCGVNDDWHSKKGVPLDEYKENIFKP